MTMDVRGTTEIVSWVLGFGDKARVIAPEALRADVARELERASRAYR
jgi:predicted DNA-binding transcriptional regulator YafY